MRLEPLEERQLLAVGPQLIGVIPNQGEVLEDGEIRNLAPQELTFRFDENQVIDSATLGDPATLGGIQIRRSGQDDLFGNGNDIIIMPGFVDVGERLNEVIFRFADALPDDLYRITIFGVGPTPLRNVSGEPFNGGINESLDFELDLGAQIIAVVPQPVSRDVGGNLVQARDTLEVYFNHDQLDIDAAENLQFYQLIATNRTADSGDDAVFNPVSVSYNAAGNKAVLTFAGDLENLVPSGSDTVRLRVGNEYQQIQTSVLATGGDAGSSFGNASEELGTLGVGSVGQSVVITGGSIAPTPYDWNYLLEWPGGVDEPGHRELPDVSPLSAEDHYLNNGTWPDLVWDDPFLPDMFDPPTPWDKQAGITTTEYNFQDEYGFDPYGNVLHNLITEVQKDRAREAFELLGNYLGVQFIETAGSGVTVATGDIRAIDPTAQPGSIPGLAAPPFIPGTGGLVVISASMDWGTSPYGGGWFTTAMREISRTLGYGDSFDMPPETIMGGSTDPAYGVGSSEWVFPGDHDVVHGQYMYRPDGNDIDLYKFTLETAGLFSAETIAERREAVSQLDSALTLFKEYEVGGEDGPQWRVVSRNDDYYSEDSYLELDLEPGTYYLGVTSTGNIDYDPIIENSGVGGTSQGEYDLRVDFTPDVVEHMIDTTATLFDGDADGIPGGVYNFWFNFQSEQNTIFVDKAATGPTRDGSLANPYTLISEALAAAEPGQIVRIVGNNFQNDDPADPATMQDNQAYEIGYDVFGNSLRDGKKMEIRKGVTVMIDAGAVFKLRKANIDVGSSAQGIDRSLGALQVLGTPEHGVYFTSFHNEQIGTDGEPLRTTVPVKGDWGGLVFRNQLDYDAGRTVLEEEEIFLNYVNHADISYGGGSVVVNSIQDVYNPIHMIQARPTVSFNTITKSADAAISADPNSFEDTKFQSHPGAPVTVSLADALDPANDGTGLILSLGRVGTTSTVGSNASLTITPSGDNNDLTITANTPGSALAGVDVVFVENPGSGDQAVVTFDGVTGTLTIELDPSATTAATVLAAVNLEGTFAAALDATSEPTNDGSGLIADLGVMGTTTVTARAQIMLLGDDNDLVITADTPGPEFDNVDVVLLSSAASGDQAIVTFEGATGTLTIDVDPLATTAATVLAAINGEGTFAAALDATVDPTNDGSGLVAPWGTIATTAGGAATIVLPGDNNDFLIADLPGPDVDIVLVHERAMGDRAMVTHDAVAGTLTIDIDPAATTANAVVDAIGRLDTFTADYERVGPEIHGNRLVENTINGIFVRIHTQAGRAMDELEVNARFDDTDIVHVIAENLIINGTPGGPVRDPDTSALQARLDARLAIDPGIVVKMDGARIEAQIGTQLIAEGTLGRQVTFTSLLDNRFGAGGTFATAEDSAGSGPAGGDWGGLYFGPVSQGSIDHALIAHAGGTTTIEGGFARFNPVEIHQARVRITNSVLDDNSDGGAGDRNGRGPTVSSTIFVRGAQPVIAENVFRRNEGPVISIDANSMQSVISPDWGRSTGQIDAVESYADNHGPLVRGNRLGDNEINGMEVRGGTLTTETVWDDTDIVHVLFDEIVVPNHHTYSGLRLQSRLNESLVVKLSGDDAGFTATGSPQEIDDRIGGTVQIVGAPEYPVVLTSLADDTFGAGLDPRDRPQNDTDNRDDDPAEGDWRSIKLDAYSNDRNVGVVNELEKAYGTTEDANGNPLIAQYIGDLGPHEKGGDDNLRLGFQVNGFIRFDEPGDVDVYAFKAEAGTEVWLDIDRSTHALDTVVELLDADGFVLAATDDSLDEERGLTEVFSSPNVFAETMDRDVWLTKDFYTTNPRDAGMRVALPGPAGETGTYYVRVSSAGGTTKGAYELQVRLRELQEYAGSTVRHASIHYATNGIEILGMPTHSPLLAELAEVETAIGASAWAVIAPGGSNNDVFLIANTSGPAFNGVDVILVNNTATGDQAFVTFDSGAGTLTIDIDPAATTANTVAAAITGEGTFTARLNLITEPTSDGTGLMAPLGTAATTTGGVAGGSNNNTFAAAQSIGNLLDSDRSTLQIAGSLAGPGDIDWYQFSLDFDKPDVAVWPSSWPVTFDIDYADGMERPDLNIWVFDSAGNLILTGRDSNVVDDRPGPLEGADIDNLARGTVGALDPLIGTVQMPEGNGVTYYVAITGQDLVPNALSQSLLRQEPITSLHRIAEDHIDGRDLSLIDGRPYPNFEQPWPYTASLFPDMNLHADDFHLGDVVLYVGTEGDLYTIDPFTGAFETDVTNDQAPGDLLPDVFNNPWLSYGDIAMRNDGMLFSFTGFGTAANVNQNQVAGQFRRFDTGDARNLLLDNDNQIETYRIDPQSGNVVIDNASGVQFDALVHLPVDQNRRVYAVGHRQPGNGVEFVRNLLYRFDESGVALQHPNLATDPRLPTDIVPVARLLTGPAIKIPIGATDVDYPFGDPGDLLDGLSFTIDDGSAQVIFEFDSGLDVRLDSTGANAARDGETFTLDDGTTAATFEFNGGPVLVHGDATTLVDGDTFTLQDDAGVLATFEFNDVNDPDPVGQNVVEIQYAPLQSATDVFNAIVAAINGVNNMNIVADGFLPGPNRGRITLTNDVLAQLGPLSTSIQVEGGYGLTDPSHVEILFEETMPSTNVYDPQTGALIEQGFGERIVGAVEAALSQIDAGFAHRTGEPLPLTWGDRITFYGAEDYQALAAYATAAITPIGPNNDMLLTAVNPSTNYNDVDVVFVDDVWFRTVDGGSVVDTQTFSVGQRATTQGKGTATVLLPGDHNDFAITSVNPGFAYHGIDIRFVRGTTTGDQATVSFDPDARTLTIEIDPAATTTNTVLTEIDAEGTFTGVLDWSADFPNFGTGLIVDPLGNVGTTALRNPAATIALEGDNNDFRIIAATPDDPELDGVDVEFTYRNTGDQAAVTFDRGAGRLMIDIDPTATTANTVVAAINAEGTFTALRDETGTDDPNDLSGLIVVPPIEVARTVLFASATITLAGENNDFSITATTPGSAYENVDVVFVHQVAGADEAFVNYNAGTSTLTVDIHPLYTTANTVLDAINAEGTFTAALDQTGLDVPNDGSGLIAPHDRIQTTSVYASATIALAGGNNDFTITAVTAGADFDGVQLVFKSETASGDQALADYDDVTKTLTVDIDPVATTANTVIAEIIREGTFTAALDATGLDDPNDGSGLVVTLPALAPVPAGGAVTLRLAGKNNDFEITDVTAGTDTNVVFVNGSAVGDQAIVTYDAGTSTLTIDVDPVATTANAVVAAINADGTFSAALRQTASDNPNDGSGLIVTLPDAATTSLAGSYPTVTILLAGENNDLRITSLTAGNTYDNVNVLFTHTQMGNLASATYHNAAKTLTIDIDPLATTAATVVDAILSEGTFTAVLDETGLDQPNDGSGLIAPLTTVGTTSFADNYVSATVELGGPNNDLMVQAVQPGQGLENIPVEMRYTQTGGQAQVTFDEVRRALVIDIDPGVTTGNTIIAEFSSVSQFNATLDETGLDKPNDGTGPIIVPLREVARTGLLASATITLAGENNDFSIAATTPGSDYEDVDVVFAHQVASADEAFVDYDAGTKTLTIDIHPLYTTANTVLDAINAEGTFSAALDQTGLDIPNDGSGLIAPYDRVHTTSVYATATISLAGSNNEFTITAVAAGPDFEGVELVFKSEIATGDQALADYDDVTKTLTVDIDPVATTANTVIAAINAEGTFTAAVDATDPDNPNDGSGLIGTPPALPPVPAGGAATMRLAGENNDFEITEVTAGTDTNVVFVNSVAAGDQAIVTYDAGTSTLTIDVDPGATTANTVVAAINAGGTFTAALEATDPDNPNDGSGLVGTPPALPPVPAAGSVKMRLAGENNDFEITDVTAGTDTNVVFVSSLAAGDQAIVTYDAGTSTLTIDIDPVATTANAVVAAINAGGTFTAALDQTGSDNPNDGSGLILTLSEVGTASLAESYPSVTIPLTGENNDLRITSRTAGNTHDNVNVLFTNTQAGGLAVASYNNATKTLTIDIDPLGTTAATVVDAVVTEGTFTAVLDETGPDQPNDGSGLIAPLTTVGTTVLDERHASAMVELGGPNNDLLIEALQPGFDNTPIELKYTQTGGQAQVTFDAARRTLVIAIDPGVTTGNTVIAEFDGLSQFRASLDETGLDKPNDGTGPIIVPLEVVGTTSLDAGNASATVLLSGDNNDLLITAVTPGPAYAGVDIIFEETATGDQAVVTYVGATKILTVAYDPGVTTANTVVDAINAEGTFTAALDTTVDPTNDGSGLTGTPPALPPVPAGGSATMLLAGENNDFEITDVAAGTDTNVVFVSGVAVGDQAIVTYDAGTSTLTIDVDPLATTANTVVAAINTEGTFTAVLEATDPDNPDNDGTGLISLLPVGGPTESVGFAAISFGGPDNDLTITANALGSPFDSAEVLVVADPGLSGDQATVTFDDTLVPARLTIEIDPTATTANTVIAAINAEGTFTAALDDTGADSPNNGTGVVTGATIFELDTEGNFDPANQQVLIDANFSAAEVAVAVANAINNALGAMTPPVTATALGDLVYVTPGGTVFDPGNTLFTDLTVTGDNARVFFDIGSDPRTLIIDIDPAVTTASTIVAAINAEGTFRATLESGDDGSGRIDVADLGVVLGTTAGGSGVPSFTLATTIDGVTPSGTGIDSLSDFAIPFAADDTWQDLVAAVEASINGFGTNLSAQVQEGNIVAVDVPFGTAPRGLRAFGDSPLEYRGEGPGGDVTGMAYLGGELYAVSDRGGLYRLVDVENYGLHPFKDVDDNERVQEENWPIYNGAELQYIWPSADSLVGIEFSGLAAGPQTVEQARYSNLLFATSLTGSLYAFDPTGALAPIFLDGESSVQLQQDVGGTPLSNVTGVDFSTIDYNLWHVTNYHGDDAGHGVNEADSFDGSRLLRPQDVYPIEGQTSFYFGLEDPRPGTTITVQPGAGNYTNSNPGVFYSYDVPGGAHGSLTTDTFSLLGYDPADKPVLYFNYFLEAGGPQNYDSARVFISSDGGADWQQLTTLSNSGGGWLQAKIGLGGYAGLDNLKLRFDFATSGDMHVGDADNLDAPDAEFLTGSMLRALPASELADGDAFNLDGTSSFSRPTDGQWFEFDLGYELVAPNVAGAAIQDDPILGSEWFSIEDQTGQVVVFEFDKDGSAVVGDVAIPIGHQDTTFEVATAIGSAVAGSGLSGVAVYVNDAKVTLQNTANMTQSAGAAVILQGDNGVAPTSTPVPIVPDMTADEVAVQIAQAVDQYYSGLRQFQVVDGAALVSAQQFTAALDATVDVLNDGTGLVSPLGIVATTVSVTSASIAPTGDNNDFTITSAGPGAGLDNIDVVFVNNTATGDQAIVVLDVVAGTLTIDVDPTATTANIVVAEINAEGTFTAALDTTADPTNDGSGLIVEVDVLATTSLVAVSASVPLAGENNDLRIDAVTPDPNLDDIDVVFVHTPGIGDAAVVTFSGVTLSIEFDPLATTASTVIAEIDAQGTFTGTLDTTADPTNDGTGLISPLGTVATTVGVASASVTPTGLNTDFTITSALPGPGLDNIDVVFANSTATGDQAIVTFDAVAGTLTIDVDPTATTANTVVAEISAQGTFTAALDTTADPTNDGSGLIGDFGRLATTSLVDVSAGVPLAGENNDFTISAVTPDPMLEGVEIIFVHNAAAGDQALATYDDVAGTLTIDIDPAATTVNTVRAAIGVEGTFSISDGNATFVFEFENTAFGDGVAPGNIPLLYDPAFTADDVATTVVAAFDAQNSATATIALAGENNDLLITAATPGLALDNTDILFVSFFATGDQALVTYDPFGGALIIDVDPAATTANTVMSEINAQGTFTAVLDTTVDLNNDGSGLISPLGTVATTSDGASLASATIMLPGDNNDLAITAVHPGLAWEGIDIALVYNAAAGDQAIVTFDPLARALTVDVDPAATTANTVIAAVNAEGTFTAVLDTTLDLGNDGTGLIGLIAQLGTVGTTSGDLSLASATITPAGDNNDLTITAIDPGVAWEGVGIVLVNNAASGDQAIITFDSGTGTLTIDVDPAATTANTIMAEINAEGTFTAVLDTTLDPGNDGSGLIAETGTLGTTAAVRSATLTPAGDNNDLTIAAVDPGPAWEGIDIVLVGNAASGDQAIVTFDAGAGALTIDVDPLATTVNTVIAAINAEGTFTAALDTALDPGNDGTGLIAETGTVSTAAAVRSATITLAGDNNDLAVTAVTPGPAFDGIDLVFVENAGAGDAAIVSFDAVTGALLIAIDPLATTANTVVAEINAEGTFTAVLETAVDLTNDGTGLIAPLYVVWTASTADYINVTVSSLADEVTFDGPVVLLDLGTSVMTPVGSVDLPGEFTSMKVDGDLLHIIGHSIPWDNPASSSRVPWSGSLPYYNELPGDHPPPNPAYPFDRFHHFARGQDNLHEGLYIDDLMIGFAERGEMMTGQTPDTTFTAVDPGVAILSGNYQLEIRVGTEYGMPLYRAYDTNDRLNQGITLLTLEPGDIFHGRQFTVSDGVNEVTFEFVDPGIGATGQRLPIFFYGTETAGQIADLVAQAVNSVPKETWPDVSASSIPTSNRVDLSGAAWAEGIDFIVYGDDPDIDPQQGALVFPQGPVRVTGIATDGNSLRDAILGEGITTVGDAELIGGPTSAGFWTDGVNSGILLTTGEANFAMGPNTDDGWLTSGDASMMGDAELDAEFGLPDPIDPFFSVTEDTTSLEFEFISEGGDLFFEFVFASEEYNEFVRQGYNDVFAFFLDGTNIALVPGTNVRVSIDSINGGNPFGSNPTNERYYHNNDPNDGGQYLDLIGYDGFTEILTAQTLGLAPGPHTIRLVISDVGDQVLDSGVFIKSGSFSDQRPPDAPPPYSVSLISSDKTDANLFRDQGQVIIEANTIFDSEEYAIVVDAAGRDTSANWPHPGSVAPLREVNTQRLVPGVTIENNLIAYGGDGGILFSGEPNPAGTPTAAVPFGRIVNNTIFGGVTTVPPSLPAVSFVPSGPAVPMFGTDSDWTVVPPPGVIPNDDLSTAIQDFGFTFEFYGNDFTQFYINNNGNISFEQPLWDFTPSGFPYVDPWTGQAIPMVAPFWADVDTRPYPGSPPGSSTGSVHLATGTSPAGNAFVQIDWVDVGYYDTTIAAIVPNLGYQNNFTLYIEDDPLGDIIAFGYGNMEWTTGEVDSPLMNGFGGEGAQIGFDAGNMINSFNVSRPSSQADLAALMASNNGQIVFQMDPSTGIPVGSGGGAGIRVEENASPTILNNIVAGLDTGIDVDATSSSTVIGGTVYKGNQADYGPTTLPGAFAATEIPLGPDDPLFVNALSGNFYLAAGSRAIDSSVNSLPDRPELTTVRAPLGIPPSPILAPDQDLYGQLRADDPDVAPPPGMGLNVFKDRGALDRIDFDGPAAKLIVPLDNDAGGIDRNPVPHEVFLTGEIVSEFAIQLSDSGRGIDDNTVSPATVTLLRDGVLLTEDLDYVFSYDRTNDVIHLIAAAGVWTHDSIYQIQLDNSFSDGNWVGPIQDLAANLLTPNQQDGTVKFTIQLGGGTDYGDAPDPTFPTLQPAGASHEIVEGFFLGFGVDPDANGRPSPAADADAFDDGVTFDTDVPTAGQAQVTVRASAAGRLDAWIDYNRNGVWEDTEQIFASEPLVAGLNPLTFTSPGGVGAVAGESFARFRFSTAGGLLPGGAASDGEVEDYQVQLVSPRWQNPTNNLDVNGDGVLSPQDALFLANFLYFNGQQPVPDGPGTPPFPADPPPYYDVNGDNFVGVQDGLLVVTALRNQPAPEGEGGQLPAQTASSSFVFTETVIPSVTVGGIPSTNDRALAEAVVAAGSTISGNPVSEPTAASSDRVALAALFFADTVTPSARLGGIPSINNREPTAAPSNRVAAAVDQIMSATSVANEIDFIGGIELLDDGSRAAIPRSDSDALDDFFAQLEDVEQLEQFGEPARVAAGSDQR